MELLLIAGDLFHRQPLLRELKEVDYLFSKLSVTQVVLIAGNHDYIKEASYYRTFVWSPNVHMIQDLALTCVELPALDTAVFGLSYHEREIRKPLYHEERPQTKMRFKILLAHGGDENHIPFQKEILAKKDYDYIALGHIHKPGELVPGKMVYAGALEPIDKNDVGMHGYIAGNITKHACRTTFVPWAVREYRHLKIEVNPDTTGFALHAQINREIEKNGVMHIYKLILTGYRDPEVVFDLKGMDLFGNIVEIKNHTRPAYDFQKLLGHNKENLLGKYIQSFEGAAPGSVEYEALCEGVAALMESRKGQR